MNEIVLARDKFKTKIVLCLNQTGGCDLRTDGRVYLNPRLALELSDALKKLANGQGKWKLSR